MTWSNSVANFSGSNIWGWDRRTLISMSVNFSHCAISADPHTNFERNRRIRGGVIAISICRIWGPFAILDLIGSGVSQLHILQAHVVHQPVELHHNRPIAYSAELLNDLIIFPPVFKGRPTSKLLSELGGPTSNKFGASNVCCRFPLFCSVLKRGLLKCEFRRKIEAKLRTFPPRPRTIRREMGERSEWLFQARRDPTSDIRLLHRRIFYPIYLDQFSGDSSPLNGSESCWVRTLWNLGRTWAIHRRSRSLF